MWHAVRHVLAYRAKAASWGKQSAAARALELAASAIKELFAPEIASKMRPRSVENAALTIDVEHPAFVAEVRQKEKEILRRVTSDAAPIHRVHVSVRRLSSHENTTGSMSG